MVESWCVCLACPGKCQLLNTGWQIQGGLANATWLGSFSEISQSESPGQMLQTSLKPKGLLREVTPFSLLTQDSAHMLQVFSFTVRKQHFGECKELYKLENWKPPSPSYITRVTLYWQSHKMWHCRPLLRGGSLGSRDWDWYSRWWAHPCRVWTEL